MLADQKIINRAELAKIVRSRQAKGEKVVFTNGCFDILHVGHLDLFEKAKSFGDVLIIGLNSDSSVKIVKGADRPILAELDRARLLAALALVDYVVIFDEENPFEILKQLRPDTLVKGGDYKMNEIIGRDIVPEVKIVPFMVGKSTSNVIDKIRSGLK